MRIKNYLIATIILTSTLFTACTPNALDQDEQETSIEKKDIRLPGQKGS